MLKNDEKGSRIGVFWEPHFGTCLVLFRDFMLFGGCFLGVFVFKPFGDSIFTVLGTNLSVFFSTFFKLFFIKA